MLQTMETTPARTAGSGPNAKIELAQRLDRFVGARLRALRVGKGLNQTELGAAVGLTFQQIQKYEAGTNRIGAGRLYMFANILGVEVGAFFEGIERANRPAPQDSANRATLETARHLGALSLPLRRSILSLVKTLADSQREGRPDA